jgi:hypothetical protein
MQLDLDFAAEPRACECGRALVEHVEHYRGLCCMCILRRTSEGHVWSEDPEPKRAHLQRWLAQRGAV